MTEHTVQTDEIDLANAIAWLDDQLRHLPADVAPPVLKAFADLLKAFGAYIWIGLTGPQLLALGDYLQTQCLNYDQVEARRAITEIVVAAEGYREYCAHPPDPSSLLPFPDSSETEAHAEPHV